MFSTRPFAFSFVAGPLWAVGWLALLSVGLHFGWHALRWPPQPFTAWPWLSWPTLISIALWALAGAGLLTQLRTRQALGHALYKEAYRTLPDAAGITSVKDGRFLDVNPAFCQLLGLELHQVVGRTNTELKIYATPQERLKLLDTLALKGRADRMRILCQAQGELMPGTISAVPITISGEECMLFVFQDMREHEHALQKLHTLNRQLQQAGQLAKLGAWEDRRGQGITYWSDMCYDMHGLPRGGPLPANYLNTFVAPEYRQRMRDALKRCLQTRSDWALDMQIVRANGQKMWVHSRGEAVVDNDGNVVALRGVLQDINEHKQQEELIREREALLSVTLEAAALGRWDWNLHNGMISGDSDWCKMNHLHPTEGPASLGPHRDDWHWTELISSHDVPRFNSELVRHIDTPEDGPFDITWRMQPPTGRSRWLRSIGKVISHDLYGRPERMLGVCLDVTAQQEQKQSLQQLAHFDPLTGLANRVELAARLDESMQLTRQSVQSLGVLYLDLDSFKPINDRLGHDAGDRLLVLVAKRLQHALRHNDCVARFGGDEFVLLLNQINSRSQCESLLQRLMASICRPYSLDGETVQITASIGYTLYPEDDSDADTLIRHADQAMYQAKQTGRNRIQAFDTALERTLREQQVKGLRLREGLNDGEFALYVQPKIDTRQRRVMGLETLARWHHPERGLLTPQDFMPLLEGSDLEVPFGQWAIREALSTITTLIAIEQPMQVAVNISARHLQHPEFAHWLTQLFAQHPHIPPGLLDLEITETAALYDLQHVAVVLERLRALKVSVTLDDFGTGYSSLTYLRSLPLDALKIDRSFVNDMLSDPGDMAIVHGVASLAHAFGYTVIAEGVETEEQCSTLQNMGCHFAQGYYFARPMPLHELPNWLKDWHAGQLPPQALPA